MSQSDGGESQGDSSNSEIMDVVKDDDDELSYREGCLMDFSGAKNILYALIGMI